MARRVWIITDKRYGDSDESHWIAEVSHDPTPEVHPDEQSVWDRVESRGRRFETQEQAIEAIAKMRSNVISVGSVYQRSLQKIERDVYDWRIDDEPEEFDCLFIQKCETRP